jgi:DNA helicase-2/ATP-dependent DNA helicase PcrA
MNDASQWLEGLNEEQRKAAAHVEGPLLILAGAGSGKTTVLVARTGYLLASGACKAENLAVLTFTNKAARELIERVRRKLGAKAKGLWTGTFHSFGLSLLREDPEKVRLPKKFGIVDASDAAGILKDFKVRF